MMYGLECVYVYAQLEQGLLVAALLFIQHSVVFVYGYSLNILYST